MSAEQSALVPIEFKSSVVARDDGMLVTGLFDGEPAACVALLKCRPEAGLELAARLRAAAVAQSN